MEEERLMRINRFKYMQNVCYKYKLMSIHMSKENINIVDNMSLQDIDQLTKTLDKYGDSNIDVITTELSNDISDLSKYFAKFNIYNDTKQYLMYHYYDNIIIT